MKQNIDLRLMSGYQKSQRNIPGYFVETGKFAFMLGELGISIVSSDRSSYSDDGLVYIQRPLFEILSIQAFL